MFIIEALDKAIRAVAPIHGVSCADLSDKTTWRIDFKDGATQEQRNAAQDVVDTFDPTQGPSDEDRIDNALPQTDTARVIFEAIFELANDVRELKGQSAITRAQLRDWLKAKLP